MDTGCVIVGNSDAMADPFVGFFIENDRLGKFGKRLVGNIVVRLYCQMFGTVARLGSERLRLIGVIFGHVATGDSEMVGKFGGLNYFARNMVCQI